MTYIMTYLFLFLVAYAFLLTSGDTQSNYFSQRQPYWIFQQEDLSFIFHSYYPLISMAGGTLQVMIILLGYSLNVQLKSKSFRPEKDMETLV